MSPALVISPNPQVVGMVQQAWGPDGYAIAPVQFPATMAALMQELQGAPMPEVAVLDPGDQIQAALSLATELSATAAIPVVLVSEQGAELALPALRAGVRDIVSPYGRPEEMRQALQRAATLNAGRAQQAAVMAPPPPTGQGKVITVASPKGGVGKTTVSTNLAVGLAMREPQSTVLVDIDLHFGDVASALNLNPEYTLPDMAHGPVSRDSVAVKSYLTEHSSGLFVVPGSESPAAADTVSAKEIGTLLQTLTGQFKYVVVDTAPGLGEHTLAVLDQTDILVLVTSLDVPGVRGLRKELDTLRDISIVLESRIVVLNFMHASRGLTAADVEATIGRKVDIQLPQSNSVPISTNQGVPLLQGNGRDPVAKQLRSLVDLITTEQKAQPKGHRFFDFGGKKEGQR